MSYIGTTIYEIETRMQRRERYLSVVLSGIALSLAVIAAKAASDQGQGRDIDFERDKITYIRQYAVPAPSAAPKSELLFTRRGNAARPAAATAAPTTSPTSGVSTTPPAATAPAAPPPPVELAMSKFAGIILIAALFSDVAVAQTAQELEAKLKATPDNISLIEQTAKAHAKNKNWKKVIELLNQNTDQATPRGFLQLSAAYEELKDYANVVRILNLISEKKPKDFHIHYLLGDAHIKYAGIIKDIKNKQVEEGKAIESFRLCLRYKRDFRMAHQALVNYFLKAGLNHEAREQINDMLKVFGAKGDLHADLCRLYSNDGFLPQAIKHCQKAMQLSPDSPDSYVYISQTYFDQKEIEKSEKAIIMAAKKFPNSEFAQYGAGQFYLTSANFSVASKYLQRAVASDQSSARSQISYANSLFGTGMYSEALPHFSKACELDSANQGDFLSAASKLRLKSEAALAQKYSQAAGGCKKN